MTQINPNINTYNIYQGKNDVQNQPVRIPNYYYVPDNYEHKSFKETIKDSDPMGIISPFIEHPFLVLPTWLALNFGADAFSNACAGNYEGSLTAKAARFGDRIQGSKLIQNKPVQSVLKGLGSAKKAGHKVVENSALLRAMRDTPTMPEWSLVKSQMFNQKQEVVQEFVRITEALKLVEDKAPQLKDIGLTSKEEEMLRKTFNVSRIKEIPETKAVNQVLLSRLGRTDAQIKKIQALGEGSTAAVKKEILKELGMTPDKLKLIKDDLYGKYIADVEEAVGKVGSRVKMGAGHFKWLGPLTKPFERTIGCDRIYNNLHSMSSGSKTSAGKVLTGGAKTATGRFTSKMMQMLYRGLTFGGGKAGLLLFIAPLLIESVMNTRKADKDQKVGTFMGSIIESMSWVFTFPLALRMMHAFGGVKYAGMDKKQVEAFRNAREAFNEKAKAGKFASKSEYKAAKKKVKDMLKVDGQNILTKGIRKLGSFMTMDLEMFKGYKNSNVVTSSLRKLPNGFRNVFGIPLRVAIWAGLTTGVLDGMIHKCSNMIFGKAFDSMKYEEHEAEIKKQKQFLREDLNKRLYEAQKIKQYGSVAKAQTIQPQQGQMLSARGKGVNSDAIPEIMQPKEENKIDNYTYIPSSGNTIPRPLKDSSVDTYSYIPSSENIVAKNKEAESKKSRYIPSQAAANIQKNFDNSGLQAALDRAQRAEDNALRVLAGNFEGMV